MNRLQQQFIYDCFEMKSNGILFFKDLQFIRFNYRMCWIKIIRTHHCVNNYILCPWINKGSDTDQANILSIVVLFLFIHIFPGQF